MPIANYAAASCLNDRGLPTHHMVPYDGGESTSIPPVSPIQDASSTTATVPRQLLESKRVSFFSIVCTYIVVVMVEVVIY